MIEDRFNLTAAAMLPSTDFHRDALGMWWWRRSADGQAVAAILSREGFSNLDLCRRDASRFERLMRRLGRAPRGEARGAELTSPVPCPPRPPAPGPAARPGPP